MITLMYKSTPLSLASDSDAEDWEDMELEVELENDLETETGYINYDGMESLMVMNIFASAVIAGVMLGAILWRKL